jgi:hypothetical protein
MLCPQIRETPKERRIDHHPNFGPTGMRVGELIGPHPKVDPPEASDSEPLAGGSEVPAGPEFTRNRHRLPVFPSSKGRTNNVGCVRARVAVGEAAGTRLRRAQPSRVSKRNADFRLKFGAFSENQ